MDVQWIWAIDRCQYRKVSIEDHITLLADTELQGAKIDHRFVSRAVGKLVYVDGYFVGLKPDDGEQQPDERMKRRHSDRIRRNHCDWCPAQIL